MSRNTGIPSAAAATDPPAAPRSEPDLGCEPLPGVWAVLYPASRLGRLQEAYRAGGGSGSIAEPGAALLLLREPGRELTGPWAALEGLWLESEGSSWQLTVLHAVDWDLVPKPGAALLRLSRLGATASLGEVAAPGSVITVTPAWDRVLEESGPAAAGPA